MMAGFECPSVISCETCTGAGALQQCQDKHQQVSRNCTNDDAERAPGGGGGVV